MFVTCKNVSSHNICSVKEGRIGFTSAEALDIGGTLQLLLKL